LDFAPIKTCDQLDELATSTLLYGVHFGRKFRKTNAGNLAKVMERVTITVKVSIIGESAIFNQFNDFGVPDDAIFTAVCALPLIKTGVIYVA